MPSPKSPTKKGEAYPKKATYRGRQIVIRSPRESRAAAQTAGGGTMLIVEIDGRPIEVEQAGPAEFHSVHVPYKAYSSPMELAEAVVDTVPSFKPGTGS
jgi:hypothetical protein